MKYCFIVNPQARNGRSGARLKQLLAEIGRQGLAYDYSLAEGLEHAERLSQEANRSRYDVITAVGGDGTINRVINGFYNAQGQRLSSARLGVVHTGTSPDLCRSYGIPTAMESALATLALGVTRSISIGRIRFSPTPGESHSTGASSPPRQAFFACCANIGLGAQLARLANGGIRQYAGDFLGTLLSLLRVLLSYHPRPLQLTVDGRPKTVPRVFNVSVGKTFYIASGLKVRHSLSEGDHRFYVLCVSNLTWMRLPAALKSMYNGRPLSSSPCLSLEYAREVTLTTNVEGTGVEFDGDPAGYCPCRIDSAAETLDLITSSPV